MSRPFNPSCSICGALKEPVGKRLACAACNRRRSSEWQKANPDRVNEKNGRYRDRNREQVQQHHHLRKLEFYGLTPDRYQALLEEQGYACRICRQPEIKQHANGTVYALAVDHDHQTGAVRGLLCSACNTGLANFRENVQSLARAIAYLSSSMQAADMRKESS